MSSGISRAKPAAISSPQRQYQLVGLIFHSPATSHIGMKTMNKLLNSE